MSLDFCAIDFETANRHRGSACAVGLVKVLDSRIVATRHHLMRPPEAYDEFDPFNVRIHGITSAMVEGQPRFATRLPEILTFVGGFPLIAHNAAFDMGVIRAACFASDLPCPDASYACTLGFSRATWSLLSYSLPWVAEAAGVVLDHHHDPEADARAAALILVAIAEHHQATNLEEVAKATGVPLGSLGADGWHGGQGAAPTAGANASPDQPLYGREFVFTGQLGSMTRPEAWDRVLELGGRWTRDVTKRTNVLVIGYQDASRFRPGESLSGKARAARDLRDRGQRIEIMSEPDFLKLLV